MTIARRQVAFLMPTAGAILAVAAFLLAWFHYWAARGDGKGRGVVMHGPWNFWGPPIVVVVAILAAGWLAWRQSEWRTWARATLAGLVWAIPAWLLAVIPGAFLAGFLTKVGPAGGRGPVEWFAGYHHSHVGMTGDGLVLMFVLAGPLALGALVPIVAASLAGLRRPAASLPPVVSGAATAATVLVVAAFAGLVVPGRKTEERARTDPFTERRRHALIEKGGDPNLAFLAAARRGRVDEIEALLPARPLPDVADESGRTPLMLAADGCHADAVRVILRHGGSVARTDLDGRDPLAHAFATAKGPECDRTIRVLSYAGARPQRNLLCARLVEAAAAGDTARTDVLVNVARKNYMTDLLAVAHESAVRSRQHDTARKIAAYGPLPPAGSCGAMEPATAVAR